LQKIKQVVHNTQLFQTNINLNRKL
jgi:hypothetical protein